MGSRGDPKLDQERAELLSHLRNSMDLLRMIRDPARRKSVIDLVAFLGSRLAKLEADEKGPLPLKRDQG
jgi:hypothetical protein